MNRAEFGKLVASLRKEHEDERGDPWNQERLAEEANRAIGAELYTARIIGGIERGERGLDQDSLVALADALELTSGERRELFLAASGVEDSLIARQDNDPQEVFAQLITRMKKIHLPAHIIDCFCDNVAVNSALVDLFDLGATDLIAKARERRPFSFNALRLLFQDEGVQHFRRLTGDAWSDLAIQFVMLFRTVSLRYRATEYFQALLQELRKARWFKRYWREAYFNEKDRFTDSIEIRLQSPKWGPLTYYSTYLTALTRAGELYLSVCVPADGETALAFSRMVETSGDIYYTGRLGSWPEKDRSH